MDELERLFLDTLDDLEERLDSNKPYDILGISWLLRKLLLDEKPIVDQVNQKYRLKIRFEISNTDSLAKMKKAGIPIPVFYTVQDGFDPETSRPGARKQTVKKDTLLRQVLMIINGEEYTVLDIVRFEAHIMGGIHKGVPESEQERIIEKIGETLSVGGYRASLRQLKSIGRVVIKGLEILRKRVRIG